jgi:hypothetical protein
MCLQPRAKKTAGGIIMAMGDAFGPGERRPQLRGVSGWLLCLCIALVLYLGSHLALLLWAMFVTASILARGGSVENLRPETLILWLVMVGLYGLGTAGGVLLYREKLLGVRLVQAFFGVQLALGLITLTEGFEGVLPTVLGGAGLAYLFKSERVRNTYFAGPTETAADVFR